MSSAEEEEDWPINYVFVSVVGTSAALMGLASCGLISYSLIVSPRLGSRRYLLVYFLAIGATGLLQALYEAYLVLGETVGFLATKAITGCFIIAFVEKYLESLPFMLFAAFCAELAGAFSCCMRERKARRSLLVLLQITMIILALNIAVFVNTKLQTHTIESGESFNICVNTIPTKIMLIALRVSALGIGYAAPFLILVFLHLIRLCSHDFPISGLSCFTFPIFCLRWLSWLPVHVHAAIFELGLVSRVLNTETVVKLHNTGSILVSVSGVIEMLLMTGLVWWIQRHEAKQMYWDHARRVMMETPV